jgi:hypothetical protein
MIRIGLGTMLFAMLLACVGYVAHSRMPSAGADGVIFVDQDIVLPRVSMPTCDTMRDPASGIGAMRLYVNGMDTGVVAEGCTDGPTPSAIFRLHQGSAKEQAAWDLMLRDATDTIRDGRHLQLDIQALQGGKTLHLSAPGSDKVLHLFRWWAPCVMLLVVYVGVLLVYLGAHSALVRDAAPANTPLDRRTYSLAKTQVAWWFAIVFASLVYLWLITGEIPAISAQALGLLGISSATTMASAGVSIGRLSDQGRSGVFFDDLLSDAQGVTIHRFQMVVMTIALGLAFVYDVVTKVAMPDFDPSLLALAGLSATTYVGLKIPEKTTTTPDAAVDPNATIDPKAGFTPT